jgi:hypothetical protein
MRLCSYQNKGDIIVCIDSGEFGSITNDMKYLVMDISIEYNYVTVINNYGDSASYELKRFISIDQYRDKLINNLLNVCI